MAGNPWPCKTPIHWRLPTLSGFWQLTTAATLRGDAGRPGLRPNELLELPTPPSRFGCEKLPNSWKGRQPVMYGCLARTWSAYPPGFKRKLLQFLKETFATPSVPSQNTLLVTHYLPVAAMRAYTFHPVPLASTTKRKKVKLYESRYCNIICHSKSSSSTIVSELDELEKPQSPNKPSR